MRVLFVVGLALVASASALVEVGSGYHQEVGIPTAENIRVAEEKALAEAALDNRIVGGAIAPANAHPYFAGLLISLVGISGNSVCGSSLLTANRLVTAAHCWTDGRMQAWQFTVILGSNFLFSGGTRIATSNVVMHPQYTPHNYNNDVAMILMPHNVQFSKHNDVRYTHSDCTQYYELMEAFLDGIRPISLPSGNDLWNQFVGSWAVAAGFGRTSDQQAGASTIVSQVSVQVISLLQCQMVFGNNFVVQSTLCTNGAGGVGVCGGDSGGPLVINQRGTPILIGISSFVADAGCELGHPSAFARVTSFNNFIHQYL